MMVERTQRSLDFDDKLMQMGILPCDASLTYYKYVNSDTAKKILSNGSIKFSTPKQLNDNDMELCLLDVNASKQSIDTIKEKAILAHLSEDWHLSNEKIAELSASGKIQERINNYPDEVFKKHVLNVLESFQDSFGICCLTVAYDNKKMWDKYADDGKGFCIGYKFPSLINKSFMTYKVNYENSMQARNFLDTNDGEIWDNLAFFRWLYTKRAQYSFEQEVRLFTNKNGVMSLPKSVFVSVHAGENTSQKNRLEIEGLLQNGYLIEKCQLFV